MKRNRSIVSAALILFVLLPNVGVAQGIQFYEITTEILDNGFTKNEVKITFDMPPPARLDYPIIGDVSRFSWAANFNTSCNILRQGATSAINCDLANITRTSRSLSLDYTASGFVKQLDKGKWMYRFDYQSSVPIVTLSIITKLPEGKGLIKDEDPQTAGGLLPYAPADGDTRTDGRRILIDWARNNFSAGDLLGISVVYENIRENQESNLIPLFLILITVLIVIVVSLYLKKNKIIVKIDETLDSVLPILTVDERKVIDCLLIGNGEKMQRKIVYETNFSKAKVSRLISDLKHRGIIDIEEIGRTNRVFLKKKPKEPFGTIKPQENTQKDDNGNHVPEG